MDTTEKFFVKRFTVRRSSNLRRMYLLLICLAALSERGVSVTVISYAVPTTVSIDSNATSSSTDTHPNVTSTTESGILSLAPSMDSGATMRTFYVVAFAMATVVIYFVVRAVRLRRRKSKSRKYGVITSTSALEMEPLEKGEEEDDEDTTLFEVHHHNKYGQK